MILRLNEPQNNLQLIQIGKGYVVVDLVAEIKEDNWYIHQGISPNTGIYFTINIFHKPVHKHSNFGSLVNPTFDKDTLFVDGMYAKDCKKIIFVSQSLTDQYNMSDVIVIKEDESIFQKAAKNYNEEELVEGVNIQGVLQTAFILGYKQAKENTYTEEQLERAFITGQQYQFTKDRFIPENDKYEFEKLIESLNQPKVEITFDENNQPLNCKLL